jgi:hypothetical protein
MLRVPGRRIAATTVALLCALIAVGAAVLTIVATQDGFPRPSALVKLSTSDGLAPSARAADPDFVLVTPQAHYDGVYYYAIARDPLLLGHEHERIDQAAYRYGHPMYGWLATVLGVGQARTVPAALMLLSLLGIGAAAWSASRLSVAFGRTPWGGLLVAASPGLLYAASVSTTECVGAALLGLAVLAWVRGRIAVAGALMVLLCLTKEQYVTVPLGLAIWEYVARRRHGAWPADLWRRGLAIAAGPAVLALWYVYVRAQLGSWPSTYEDGNLGAPFAGWADTFRRAHDLAGGSFDQSQIGVTATPLLVAVAVLLVAATVKAVRVRTPLEPILLGMVAITACMGWRTLLYPHELVRNPAIALLVAVGVLLSGPWTDVRRGEPERRPDDGETPRDGEGSGQTAAATGSAASG